MFIDPYQALRFLPLAAVLALAACSDAPVGTGGGDDPDPCAPDTEATVYACGDGWVIEWPEQTMVCGAPEGGCLPDERITVAVCDGAYVFGGFETEAPACVFAEPTSTR
jgi:hypothetical protein